MHITLTELRYILAIAQEKHFGRAATKCFVSQPTLSIAIKKLEENLQVQIFERDKTRLIITPVGQMILDRAQKILDLSKEIEELVKKFDPFDEPFKVGAIHTVGPYLFPLLMQSLNKTTPQLKLQIEEDFTHNLATKLINDELDAIIVAEPFVRPFITTASLYKEDLVVITPLNHHFKNKAFIKPQDLENETILLLGNGHCFRDQVIQVCPSCNLNNINTSNHIIITSSIETIKHMVIDDQGLSIVPKSSIINAVHNKFNVYPFKYPKPQRHVILAYKESSRKTSIINKVVDIIQKVADNFG